MTTTANDTITTAAELAALPVGTKVGCRGIRTWDREPNGMWRSAENPRHPESSAKLFRGHSWCPVKVLHVPEGAVR